MRSGCVPPHVGEIQILRDEEALRRLQGARDVGVVATFQPFRASSVNVMTKSAQDWNEPFGKVLVEFDVHRLTGLSASGRSSWADAAAKAIAARTSSSESVGKSTRI